jgi:cyclic beta-1,2-glucan synthetase
MERYHGHFYNWYDTQSLKPLHPRYISTVDSGNLVGHLLTLKQGLLALPHDKIIQANIFNGIRDTTTVLLEKSPGNKDVQQFLDEVTEICSSKPKGLIPLKFLLDKLQVSCTSMLDELEPVPDTEVDEWAQKLNSQFKHIIQELTSYLPWLLIPVPDKFLNAFSLIAEMPSFWELAKIEQYLLPGINAYYTPTIQKRKTAGSTSSGY